MVLTSNILIRGRIERKEFHEPFRQCVAMLKQIGAPYTINPSGIAEPFDFALFFQSYPHECLAADLMPLRRNNPFAPFCFVLGTCCEGMLRTAGSLDSPFYSYAHAWSNLEIEQIRRFLCGKQSVFSLPLTAENDEIAQWVNPAEKDKNTPKTPEKCLILTQFEHFGNDSAMNQFLADELKRDGFDPAFSGKTLPKGFSGNIYADTDNAPPEKILESIQRIRRQFADNDFTVYVDSPRIDEKINYIHAGATRILTKMRYLIPYGTE